MTNIINENYQLDINSKYKDITNTINKSSLDKNFISIDHDYIFFITTLILIIENITEYIARFVAK